MKNKFIGILALSAGLILTGCGGEKVSSSLSSEQGSSAVPASSEAAPSETVSSDTVVEKETIYAAPDNVAGIDGDGTYDRPYTFMNGIRHLKQGGTMYLKAGTYSYRKTLSISYAGENLNDTHIATSEEERKTIAPEIIDGVEQKVVFDFSEMTFNSSNRGIAVNTDYWTIKDIEVIGAGDNGIYVGGNHNIIENIDVHDCQDSGIQLGRKQSSDTTIDTWPSYNTILNCTSHDNHDPTGEDSDGFACKLTTGVGNVFDGCISYNNVDDGWDLYTKGDSGPIGAVTLKNCVAFNNGITSYGVGTANSDGNGFKLGGESISVAHKVINCIAFNNLATGFTDNSNPGTIRIENCTAYNNGTRDFDANNFDLCRNAETSVNYYRNLLSYCEGMRVSPIDGDTSVSNSRDQYKGTVSHSIFYYGMQMLKFGDKQECDYTKSYLRGTMYEEPDGKSPFVSTVSPQTQSSRGVPAEEHPDLHSLLRDKVTHRVKLGDFLKINPDSEFAKLGEDSKPLGADLSNGGIE